MKRKKKNERKIFAIDTSAILSGKPINIENARLVTTPLIEQELRPGGRDHRIFQYLLDGGLEVIEPSKKSVDRVNEISIKLGEFDRLSHADKDIIALALDFSSKGEQAVILTDDYSIQNVAVFLKIKFQSFLQKGISKKFTWVGQCTGCKKKFKEKSIKICPICGARVKTIVSNSKTL